MWASDKSFGFKASAWVGAISVWQLIDSDSYFHRRLNQYRFEQALEKSQDALYKGNRTKEEIDHIQSELNRLKTK